MSLYEYTMDRAKSALKMKISEYEMLNKTLIEMIEKGSSDIVIDTLKHDIDETLDTINELREWIEKETEKEDSKVEYSFYDGIKKPKLAKSVKLASFNKSSDGRGFSYDAIKKSVEKMNEDLKNDKVVGELNHPNLYDSLRKLNYQDLYNNSNKLPIHSPYDNVIQNNRFLVRFGTPFDIPEYYVRSVDFLYDDKELVITVLNNIKEDKRPLIAELLAKRNTIEFSISIDYLDATGVTLYTERYHNCHLLKLERESMDYTKDNLNGILLTISYSEITYETSH
jgi:hypothetical protein